MGADFFKSIRTLSVHRNTASKTRSLDGFAGMVKLWKIK
jgi:hypothetical protein